jgi:uncharacterized protein (TIGR00369 family)
VEPNGQLLMDFVIPKDLKDFNQYGEEYLFGYLGMEFLRVEEDEVIARIVLQQHHFGWNGYLHAGTIFSLADSCAGYGCVRSLPEGAMGFTTIETKVNFLSTVGQGSIQAIAKPLHRGRSTQVWDASVSSIETRQLLSSYRCTQMILWPKTDVSLNERAT